MPNLKKNNWFFPSFIFIICFIVSLYNRQNPFNMTYMQWDSSIYQYIGWRMLEGDIPYRDIFDHKGPVIYLWNMLGYSLNPMIGQWFLELIALFISGLFAFKIGCRFVSPALSLLAIGIIYFNIPTDDTIGNIVNLGVLLSYISLYILSSYIFENKITPRQSLILGSVCALLLLLKPTYMTTPATILIYLSLNLLLKKRYQEFILFALCFSCAFLSIIALISGWLFYHHALRDFWRCYIEFNLEYASYGKTVNDLSFIHNVLWLNKTVITTFLLISILLINLKRYPLNERGLFLTLFIAVILTLITIMLPTNPFLHYLYILYPLIFLLLVMTLKPLEKPKITPIILSVLFALSFLQAFFNILKPVSNKNTLAAAAMIDSLLEKDETFQTLGWDMGRLHLLTKRASSTPYVLTGMFDKLHQRYLYTYIKNSEPPLVALLTYPESHFYHQLINAYWKNFDRDYVLYSSRFGYEIYILRKKMPSTRYNIKLP